MYIQYVDDIFVDTQYLNEKNKHSKKSQHWLLLSNLTLTTKSLS